MSTAFAARYAEWQALYAASENVPSPKPDDQPEMLAQLDVQRALVALPVDDAESLLLKASLPMVNWDGPSGEQWAFIRADIERIAHCAPASPGRGS